MSNAYFILVIVVITISCKKEDPVIGPVCPNGYDTIVVNLESNLSESSEFLAAYPGSWWELSNGDTLRCENATFNFTELVTEDKGNCELIYHKTEYSGARIEFSPFTNFTHGFIDGDYNLYVSNSGELRRSRNIVTSYLNELNENYWVALSYDYYDTYGYYVRVLGEKRLIEFHDAYELPNGDIYENVAELEYIVDIHDHYGGVTYTHLQYYAKDIGLIRSLETGFESGVEPDVYVTNYYIAPH